jgi:Uma2 family endonuclease
MATAATPMYIPLETYLRTSYEPDVEYVDGELEERNVGEFDHNMIQRAILFWFYSHEKEWGIRAIQEQRTRVDVTKVRLPDVSVFSREIPIEQVFTRPQLIAIEVLSPEDRHSRIAEKIKNYMKFGVQNIWIVDSKTREGWDCSDGDWVRTERFRAANTPMYMSLTELFATIDKDNA